MSLLFFSDWKSHPRSEVKLLSDVPRTLELVQGTYRDVGGDTYRVCATDEGQLLGVSILTAEMGQPGFGVTSTDRIYPRDSRSLLALTQEGLPLNQGDVLIVQRGLGQVEIPIQYAFGGIQYLRDPMEDSDQPVRVRYRLGLSRVLWTRDEPGRVRTGFVPQENFRTFLPGGFVRKLGEGKKGDQYRIPTALPGWIQGWVPKEPAIFRSGSDPAQAQPVKASNRAEDLPDVLVYQDRVEILQDLPGPLWHWVLDFGFEQIGKVGEDLFLAPVPDMDELPVLEMAGRFLTPLLFDTDTPRLRPGEVGISIDTGRVVWAPSDLDEFKGQPVRYRGVALGLVSVRESSPLTQVGTKIEVPEGTSRSPTGAARSGWFWIPDGSGLPPTRSGTTVTGAKVSVSDLVTQARVWFGSESVAVDQVDSDRDLPLMAPPGRAVFSRESQRIVLDRPFSDPPPRIEQATYLLRRGQIGIGQLGSARRGPYRLDGSETLSVLVGKVKLTWVPKSGGNFLAEEIRDQILQDLAGKLAARAHLGRLILADPDGSGIEILYGKGSGLDLSGPTALGFPPGWFSNLDGFWILDPGLGAGLSETLVPTDTDRVGERVLANPLSEFPILSLIVSPWVRDPRLVRGSAIQIAPLGSGPPIPVRIGQDALLDPYLSLLTWIQDRAGEPQTGPILTRDGTIQLGSRVEIQTVQGQWNPVPPDQLVETASDFRLVRPFPPTAYQGDLQLTGGVGTLPAGVEAVDLAQIGDDFYPVSVQSGQIIFPTPLEGKVTTTLYGQGGFTLYGTWEPLRLLPDENIQLTLVDAAGGRQDLVRGSQYSLDLQTGQVGFGTPIPPGGSVEARYYRATPRGQRVGPPLVESVRFTQDKVVAKDEAGYFYFGTRAGQPALDLSQPVSVLEKDPAGVTQPSKQPIQYLTDPPGSGLIRAVVPSGTSFLVTYTSVTAAGGERTGTLLRAPIYLPWLRVQAGQTELIFRGDRTDQFRKGGIIRVGSELFWVGTVQVEADETTRIGIHPASDQDVGAPTAGSETIFLIGQPELEFEPGGFVTVQILSGATKGSGVLEVRSPLAPQPGSILELAGCPSWVDQVETLGESTFRVRIAMGLRARAEGAQTGRLLRAPLGLVGSDRIPGLPLDPALPGSIQVVRFENPDQAGRVDPDSQFDSESKTIWTERIRARYRFALLGKTLPSDSVLMRQVGKERSAPPHPGGLIGTYLGSGRDWFTLTLSSVPIPSGYISPWDSVRDLERSDLGLRQLLHGAGLVARALVDAQADQTGIRAQVDPFWLGPPSDLIQAGCLDPVTGRVPVWTGPVLNVLDRDQTVSRDFVQLGQIEGEIPPGWIRGVSIPVGKAEGLLQEGLSILPQGVPVQGSPFQILPGNTAKVRPGDPVWARSQEGWAPVERINSEPAYWKSPDSFMSGEQTPLTLSDLYVRGFPLSFWASQGEIELTPPPLFGLTSQDGVWIDSDGTILVRDHAPVAKQIRAGSTLWGIRSGPQGVRPLPVGSPEEAPRGQIRFPRLLRIEGDSILVSSSSLVWDPSGFGFVFGASRGPAQQGEDLWGFQYGSVETRSDLVILRGVTGFESFAKTNLTPQTGSFLSGSGAWKLSHPGLIPLGIRMECPWPSKPVGANFNYDRGLVRFDLAQGDWRALYGYNKSQPLSVYRCLIPGTRLLIEWGQGPQGFVSDPDPNLDQGVLLAPSPDPRQVWVDPVDEPYLMSPDGLTRTVRFLTRGDWISLDGQLAWVSDSRLVGGRQQVDLAYLGNPQTFTHTKTAKVLSDPLGSQEDVLVAACQFLESPWGIGIPHQYEVGVFLRSYLDRVQSQRAQLEHELLGSAPPVAVPDLPDLDQGRILRVLADQMVRWSQLRIQIGQQLKGGSRG